MTGCQLDSDSAFPTVTCRAAQIHRSVPESIQEKFSKPKKKKKKKRQKERSYVDIWGAHWWQTSDHTQVSSEGKRIQHDLDVVEAVLFPFKGVSVVCYA